MGFLCIEILYPTDGSRNFAFYIFTFYSVDLIPNRSDEVALDRERTTPVMQLYKL